MATRTYTTSFITGGIVPFSTYLNFNRPIPTTTQKGWNQSVILEGGGNNSSATSSSYSSSGSTSYSNSGSTGYSSLGSGFSTDSLPNVFSKLGEISEQKAQNDQRRFREDLPFQANVYQNFDATADARREGIDIRARRQNSNLTQDRMRLQSQLNMGEEQNRGRVQSQVKDSDLKRALSILPRK